MNLHGSIKDRVRDSGPENIVAPWRIGRARLWSRTLSWMFIQLLLVLWILLCH